MTEETASPRKTVVRRPWFLTFAALLCLAAAAAAFAWRTGPSALLRFAVRSADPALRLRVSSTTLRGGEVRLKNVELRWRGRAEPIFKAEEVSVGLGREWRRGRFGSLTLVRPALSLDKKALDHFSARSGGGAAWSWEIAEVTIRGGHIWLQQFGDPALDVSANIDAVLHRVGPAAPDQEHKLDLSGVYVAVHGTGAPVPLFGAGQAEARASIAGLVGRRLRSLRVDRGWLLAGHGLQSLVAGAPSTQAPSAPAGASGAFVLQTLDLVDLQVHTGEAMGRLPEISLRVNTALRDVALGQAAEELAKRVHQVEFADIEILSPYDPLQRAVAIRTVFAKFSLGGLAERKIDELILLSPTIYLGEALFEYMAGADNARNPPEPVEATVGWRVDLLKVNFGKLIIAVGGRKQIGLPLAFQTTARNVSLSSLAGLNASLVMSIPPDDYNFPGYDLTFRNVRGDVRLNFPPKEENNNLVNVVRFDRARWRNFTARDLWVSVTFDLQGINGLFGGEAYGGYVSGGFSFFLQPEAPWTGWITGEDLDVDALTQAAAPQHFVMSGNADTRVEVNGSGPSIERVVGNVRTSGGGRMVVNKLNDLLDAIPKEWTAIKRESTRVSLETLRDFDYTQAGADFWFTRDEGLLNVKMKGPAGSRNLEVVLHGDGPGGAWSRLGGAP
ncbi:MAG: hypothetical protein RIQ71_2457 [Verrucomicrobiota bacterium]|jgi:hypothetical protein